MIRRPIARVVRTDARHAASAFPDTGVAEKTSLPPCGPSPLWRWYQAAMFTFGTSSIAFALWRAHRLRQPFPTNIEPLDVPELADPAAISAIHAAVAKQRAVGVHPTASARVIVGGEPGVGKASAVQAALSEADKEYALRWVIRSRSALDDYLELGRVLNVEVPENSSLEVARGAVMDVINVAALRSPLWVGEVVPDVSNAFALTKVSGLVFERQAILKPLALVGITARNKIAELRAKVIAALESAVRNEPLQRIAYQGGRVAILFVDDDLHDTTAAAAPPAGTVHADFVITTRAFGAKCDVVVRPLTGDALARAQAALRLTDEQVGRIPKGRATPALLRAVAKAPTSVPLPEHVMSEMSIAGPVHAALSPDAQRLVSLVNGAGVTRIPVETLAKTVVESPLDLGQRKRRGQRRLKREAFDAALAEAAAAGIVRLTNVAGEQRVSMHELTLAAYTASTPIDGSAACDVVALLQDSVEDIGRQEWAAWFDHFSRRHGQPMDSAADPDAFICAQGPLAAGHLLTRRAAVHCQLRSAALTTDGVLTAALNTLNSVETGAAHTRGNVDHALLDWAAVQHAAAVSNHQTGAHTFALRGYTRALDIRMKARHGADHPDTALTLHQLGALHLQRGDPSAAMEATAAALKMRRKVLSGAHPYTAKTLHNMGHVLARVGRYQEAVDYHEEALAMRKDVLPRNDPHIAVSMQHLGLALLHLPGRSADALWHVEQALLRRERLLPANHPDIATAVAGLGSALLKLKRPEDALHEHQRALRMRQRSLPPSHPHIARSHAHVCSALDALGRYHEAAVEQAMSVSLLRDGVPPAIDIRGEPDFTSVCGVALEQRSGLGSESKVSVALDALGVVLERLNRSDEALKCFEEATARRKGLMHDGTGAKANATHTGLAPEEEQRYAHGLDNVVHALQRMDRDPDAVPLAREALDVRENSPADLPGVVGELALTHNTLASLHWAIGEHNGALEHEQEALRLQKQYYRGTDHSDIAATLSNMGCTLWHLGRREEARDMQQEAVTMLRRLLPEVQADIGPTQTNYARSLANLAHMTTGDNETALRLHHEALQLWRRVHTGDAHPDVIAAYRSVAACYWQLERPAKALKYEREALQHQQRLMPGDHPRTAQSLNDVATSYECTGDIASARAYHTQALEMRRRMYSEGHSEVAQSLMALQRLTDGQPSPQAQGQAPRQPAP